MFCSLFLLHQCCNSLHSFSVVFVRFKQNGINGSRWPNGCPRLNAKHRPRDRDQPLTIQETCRHVRSAWSAACGPVPSTASWGARHWTARIPDRKYIRSEPASHRNAPWGQPGTPACCTAGFFFGVAASGAAAVSPFRFGHRGRFASCRPPLTGGFSVRVSHGELNTKSRNTATHG